MIGTSGKSSRISSRLSFSFQKKAVVSPEKNSGKNETELLNNPKRKSEMSALVDEVNEQYRKLLPDSWAQEIGKSGKRPVGKNTYEAMSFMEKRKCTPNYPLEAVYQVESIPGQSMYTPVGRPTRFKCGPGSLSKELRQVKGKLNYDYIPTVVGTLKQKAYGSTKSTKVHNFKHGIKMGKDGIPVIPESVKKLYDIEYYYPDSSLTDKTPLLPVQPTKPPVVKVAIPGGNFKDQFDSALDKHLNPTAKDIDAMIRNWTRE